MLKSITAKILIFLLSTQIFMGISHAQSVPNGSTSNVSLSPATGNYDNNTQFQIDIKLTASSLSSATVTVNYDSNILNVQSIAAGTIFKSYTPTSFNNTSGTLTITASNPVDTTNVNGIIGTITMLAKNISNTTLVTVDQASTVIKDSSSVLIPFQTTNASYSVVSGTASAPPAQSNLPKTGIIDDILLPITIAWLMIISFLILLYFKVSKDDIMRRVLSQEKK